MVQHGQPHSYVWPADYNWIKPQHHADTEVSTVSQLSYPVSSEVLVPWILSMWMMGNQTPTSPTEYPKPKSAKKPGRNNNRYDNAGFRDRFAWGQIDLEYPNNESKHKALKSGAFVPANNLPLGLEVWKNKMFLSLPQWRPGIPVTLAYVNLNGHAKSPKLKPYPSWNWYTNSENPCHGLVSVFRMEVDQCDRLWVLDTGAINLASGVEQICPVKLDVFDLNTDRHVKRFVVPANQTLKDSLFTNIVVEILDDDCEDAYAYVSDVFQYGLVVYNYKKDTSHRINHPYFYPDPLYCHYNMDGIAFNWMDGIFGMCLSPGGGGGGGGGRRLYFHALSSHDDFHVATASLRNDSLRPGDVIEHFAPMDGPRCERHQSCQSSGMAMDARGVMYYNLVTRGAVGCWNSRGGPGSYGPRTQGVLPGGGGHGGRAASSAAVMSFPNDLKVDKEPAQRVWMLSNGLHKYLYGKPDPAAVNVRVMVAYTDAVVKGTVCESDG